MTIYIDTLFLLDFIVDYLLLLLTGKVTGAPLARPRLLLSAGLGGGYSVLCAVTRLPFLFHPLVKLALAALLVLVSYGHCRYLLRCTLIFLALSAAFGGGLYALSLMAGAPLALNPPTVLLFAAAAYGLLSLVGRKLARHSPSDLRRVTVRIGSRTAQLTALVDTANTLTDPMTGRGVLVAEGDALASLLPPEADYRHPAQCFPSLPDPGRYRLLPYRAVGVDSGRFLYVRAQVAVNGRPSSCGLVALSPTPVSDTGTYHALLFEE